MTSPKGSYALASATNLRLEIVSIDPGASLKVAGPKLDHAGESASIGKAPIHTHLFWQIEAPEGEIGEWRVVFRVKTPSPAYDPSPDIEVVVTNDELATTTSSSTSTSTTTLGEATCGNAVVESVKPVTPAPSRGARGAPVTGLASGSLAEIPMATARAMRPMRCSRWRWRSG